MYLRRKLPIDYFLKVIFQPITRHILKKITNKTNVGSRILGMGVRTSRIFKEIKNTIPENRNSENVPYENNKVMDNISEAVDNMKLKSSLRKETNSSNLDESGYNSSSLEHSLRNSPLLCSKDTTHLHCRFCKDEVERIDLLEFVRLERECELTVRKPPRRKIRPGLRIRPSQLNFKCVIPRKPRKTVRFAWLSIIHHPTIIIMISPQIDLAYIYTVMKIPQNVFSSLHRLVEW